MGCKNQDEILKIGLVFLLSFYAIPNAIAHEQLDASSEIESSHQPQAQENKNTPTAIEASHLPSAHGNSNPSKEQENANSTVVNETKNPASTSESANTPTAHENTDAPSNNQEQNQSLEEKYPFVYKGDTQAPVTSSGATYRSIYVTGSNSGSGYSYNKSPLKKVMSSVGYDSTSDTQFYINGFGIVSYTKPQYDHGFFNMDHFDPGFIFNYKDLFQWESLLDFSLNEYGSTKTIVEFAFLDWFIHENATLIGGKFYTPTGKFTNTLYLPWLNKLASAPVGFNYWQASPTQDVGVQLKGDIPCVFNMRATFAFFLANGPIARVDVEEDEDEEYGSGYISSIWSDGFPVDEDGNKIAGGRISIFPCKSLEIGVSGAIGEIGLFDDELELIEPSRDYHSFGVDISYLRNNIELRYEFIQQWINAFALSDFPERAIWTAYYILGAYRINSTPWEIVARYGRYLSPDDEQKQRQLAFGIDYWFGPKVVAKLTYENNSGIYSFPTDANRVIVQFSMGF